ncbi:hypothetical protein ACFTSD_01435 [Nocardiaceae bacterium NPDC056970]
MQILIERGEIIALDCSHQDTVLFFDPSYGPYEKCVECEVVLDEEGTLAASDADNSLTDDELTVDDVQVWVLWWLGALSVTAMLGLGLLWLCVTA